MKAKNLIGFSFLIFSILLLDKCSSQDPVYDTADSIVTIKAIDDSDIEGTHQATITHEMNTDDPLYENMEIDEIIAVIADND